MAIVFYTTIMHFFFMKLFFFYFFIFLTNQKGIEQQNILKNRKYIISKEINIVICEGFIYYFYFSKNENLILILL